MWQKSLFFILITILGHSAHLLCSKIHVFGDSHASFCFSNERTAIPRDEESIFRYKKNEGLRPVQFAIHWLGSKTMHAIGRDGLNVLNLRNFNVEEGDIAVFVFGEIDARCHIGKQRDLKNRQIDEIIDTLARNFLNCIYENKQLFKRLTCVVVSVTPPTNNAYNWVYPYYGSLQERADITKQLNFKLQELCASFKFKFLDIHSHYATPEGTLDDSTSDGVVHVNPQTNDQIKQMLIDLLRAKHMI